MPVHAINICFHCRQAVSVDVILSPTLCTHPSTSNCDELVHEGILFRLRIQYKTTRKRDKFHRTEGQLLSLDFTFHPQCFSQRFAWAGEQSLARPQACLFTFYFMAIFPSFLLFLASLFSFLRVFSSSISSLCFSFSFPHSHKRYILVAVKGPNYLVVDQPGDSGVLYSSHVSITYKISVIRD